MDKVNVKQKLSLINEYWSPKIIGELNDHQIKIAKLKGEFIWHKHDHEDEMFYIIDGELTIEFRDRKLYLTPGEFCIVPRGVEHRPVAKDEVSIILVEPASTLNTGNVMHQLTEKEIDRI